MSTGYRKHIARTLAVHVIFLFRCISGQDDFTCDAIADTTCLTKNDGVCDSAQPGCENGDCLDCDLCGQFDYNCGECMSAQGCFWCPGDATCFNSQFYAFQDPIFSSCNQSDDYIDDGSCSAPENFFSDPLYSAQEWVFDMIDLRPVWEQGIFGLGVRVRINDSGVDGSHVEFAGRYDSEASCTIAGPTAEANANGVHGTSVASILAAAGGNDECAVGVAPETTISSCNIFTDETNFTFLAEKLETFDISQNSYGIPACGEDVSFRRRRMQTACPFEAEDLFLTNPCDACDFDAETLSAGCETAIIGHCEALYENDIAACLEFLDLLIGGICNYDRLSDGALVDMTTGILEGRGGRGVIYVFASGNSFGIGDDVNFGGLTNTRLAITVGAVGKDRLHARYSTPGAALFISAPGGDHENRSNHIGANVAGGCHNAGVGTSFACPVVSGVIALMLEVRPELTWRDVQGVLAESSTMVLNDPDDDSRVTNAAGHQHSNLYGFGIVDANKAVTAAESWELWGAESLVVGESGLENLIVADSRTNSTTSRVTITALGDDFIAESVVAFLDLTHFSRGDLEVVLVSPQNTSSVLHPGRRPENTQLNSNERWKLMTVRAWGESAVGEWTLTIRDLRSGDVAECADSPFYTEFDSQPMTCTYLTEEAFCQNGSISQELFGDGSRDALREATDNGLTLEQACCSCGGGINTTDIEDILRQWRLFVYGRDVGFITPTAVVVTPTPLATPIPSIIPSELPSIGPSDNPSVIPSGEPSRMPSQNPTTNPSQGPTPQPVITRPNQLSTSGDKSDPTQLIITIVSTVGVFLLICLCLWCTLRDPRGSSYHQPAPSPGEGGII